MRAFAIAFSLLIVLGWKIPAAEAASGCHRVSAVPACHHTAQASGVSKPLHRRARMADWYLHRPSSPAERAQTRRLNREFLASSRTGAGSARAQSQAQGQAQSEREAQYQRDLRQYQAAKPAFDREMRAYSRSLNQPSAKGGYAPADAARRDPWHGYNARSGNGY